MVRATVSLWFILACGMSPALARQAGKLRLRDLDSTHGTKVNDYSIDDKGLTPGDKISVGYSLLIVKTEK